MSRNGSSNTRSKHTKRKVKFIKKLSREIIGPIPPTKRHQNKKYKQQHSRKGRRKPQNWRELIPDDRT